MSIDSESQSKTPNTTEVTQQPKPVTPVAQIQVATAQVKGEMKPPKPPGMETSTPKLIRRRPSLTSTISEKSTLSPYKYLTQSNRIGGPVTGSCPSEIVEQIVNSILYQKQPKQSAEITAKSLLFLKTRNSIIVTSPFEITPSVEYQRCDIFDELRHRTGTQRIAKDLIEFVAKERRKGFIYDEIFSQLRSEIIYTSYNFITAFYNNHAVGTVDQLTLAIQCVQLACKTQSTFKRLEKLVIAARSCFKTPIRLDRAHYADVEMMVLQSIGFQMQLADDYPHKYIYQFKPIMIEKFKCFKANEKKMLTLCHCAIHIATILVESSPIMLNRESSTVAAACILVANNFKPVMEISDWFKYIIGCENLDVKTLKETADLVFDTLKYNQVNWANLDIEPLVMNPTSHLTTKHSIKSNSSSPIQTSPPQQMLSPISGISETCSSGFGSESSTRLLSKNITNSISQFSRPAIERRNSIGFTTSSSPFSKPDVPRSRMCLPLSTKCQSPLVKSSFSLSSKLDGKIVLIGGKNSGAVSGIPPPPPPPMQLMLSPQTIKVVNNSKVEQKTPNSNILLQKSKSESSKNSEMSDDLNLTLTPQALTPQAPETSSQSLLSSINSPKPLKSATHQPSSSSALINSQVINSQVSTESAFTPLSSCASDDAVFDLNMSVDSMNTSCASSSYSSISFNSSQSSATDFRLHLSTAVKHPDELHYKNRLDAIKQNTDITRFYACSKERYNTLSREEKNIVKFYKQKVKLKRDLQQKNKAQLMKGKKRRHSTLPQSTNSTTEKTSLTTPSGGLETIHEAKRQKTGL